MYGLSLAKGARWGNQGVGKSRAGPFLIQKIPQIGACPAYCGGSGNLQIFAPHMPEISDDILRTWQQQIARGDENAFNNLFRHFYLNLVHFAIDLVKGKPAAEEIVSDVFVKVWQKKEDILLIDKLRVFLFVAVKNQCYNYIRDHSLWNVTLSADNVSTLTSAYNPEDDMAFRELQHQLNKIVAQLPDQCKQVFKLIKEDGLKYKEVAEILQISPRTVETQLFRAIKKIRKVLTDEQDPQQPNLPDMLLPVVLAGWFLAS